jgi:uncharacterized membrane protein
MSNNKKIYLAAAIIIIVSFALSYLISALVGLGGMLTRYLNLTLAGMEPVTAALSAFDGLIHMSAWLVLLNIAVPLFMMLLNAGFSILALKLCREREAPLSTILDGFGIFLRVIWLNILESIFVILWMLPGVALYVLALAALTAGAFGAMSVALSLVLLFVGFAAFIVFYVLGIIAIYRYRQAFYLMVENPDYSIIKCIRESKRIMRRRKGELFVLDWSFIGWSLLSAVPILGLFVSVYTMPYFETTYANYYIAVKNLGEPAEGLASPQAGELDGPQ